MCQIKRFLSNLTDMYSGTYKPSDPEINRIRKELLDISRIPTTADDNQSLKADMNNVLRDTKKAYKSIKSKLVNG